MHPFKYILTSYFKVRVIKNLLLKENVNQLLDIGCGAGFMISQLDNMFKKAIGIDMSSDAIDFAKKYSNNHFITGDAQNLQFRDCEFDSVISIDSFEHIHDDKLAIKEVYRVLKKGGSLIIYTPCIEGLFSKTKFANLYHSDKNNFMLDYRYYNKNSLENLCKDNKFKIEYIGYHNIFMQELFTQIFKYFSSLLKKKYDNQSDIYNFTSSPFYFIYKLFFPIIFILIRLEEIIFENIFLAKVKGHRLVIKCRKLQ